MEHRNGFACVAHAPARLTYVLFGPNVTVRGTQPFENLESNGLTLFREPGPAREAKLSIERTYSEFSKVVIAHFEIEWAESEGGFPYFDGKHWLFVLGIAQDNGGTEHLLIGPWVRGCRRFLGDFSLLQQNGFSRFMRYADTLRCRNEVLRQSNGDRRASIGRFVTKW